MREFGSYNPAHPVTETHSAGFKAAHYNLRPAALVQEAVARGEAALAEGGAVLALTGEKTGRSPKDKFVVDEPSVKDTIWWENNAAMPREGFEALKADMLAHLGQREVFVQDLYCGAAPAHRIAARFINELAWHILFIRNMMRRPTAKELADFTPEWTVINAPSFKADPARHGCASSTAIALSFEEKTVLIANTAYAGENKKAMFTVMNYLLPERGVMPMHCSANHTEGDPADAAIFFGLSGTGKTTLSADESRELVGDDEHGWADDGLFNFEGGCYAKTINLSAEAEPQIFKTTSMFGSVLENVVMDPETRTLDFDDARYTQNTRVCYPLDYVDNASKTGRAGPPRAIFMLTCDAFGVLPPIARLSPAQAMYHFLSGFTSKAPGTETGVTEPEPTFSTCFGAPFMPRRPEVYGALLRDKIAARDVTCWLVSTGWTGGPHGVGRRMPIKATRALLSAALSGALDQVEFRVDPNFGFEAPTAVDGVDPKVLSPRDSWADPAAYDAQAAKLLAMFENNFKAFEAHVGEDVLAVALRAG